MLEVMRSNVEFTTFIVQLQSIDVYNASVVVVDTKTLRPHERLDRLLWDLAAVIGRRRSSHSIQVILPLSDKELA